MDKGNQKKTEQLGMPFGTASGRLKKMLLFEFAKRLGLDTCHRCSKKIETVDELSVEHKEPWLDSDDPVKKFFDLNNIAFSHLTCNSGDARKPTKYKDREAYKEIIRIKHTLNAKENYNSERRKDKYLKHG